MKKNYILAFFIAVFFAFSGSKAYAQQEWGLGVRFGDPAGISIKRYLGDNALEFNFGRTAFWGGHRRYGYYGSRFYEYDRFRNRGYEYHGYDRRGAWGAQLRYLIHKDLDQLLDGLKWYYGPGVQVRHIAHTYHYRYRHPVTRHWIYEQERISDLGVGLDGVIGLEYTFKEIPISISLDVNIYMELFNNPFHFLGQSGLGIRYNF
ncbi:MAG: hypothetical protein ACK4ND_07185 [Cytophagaceae bacterium]